MVRNGIEVYTVLVQGKHHIDRVVKDIHEISEVVDIKPIALREALLNKHTIGIETPRLTKRGKEILWTALKEGFFENPKRIRIEYIARIHSVSKAYASIIIKKAIKKALKQLIKTGF